MLPEEENASGFKHSPEKNNKNIGPLQYMLLISGAINHEYLEVEEEDADQ